MHQQENLLGVVKTKTYKKEKLTLKCQKKKKSKKSKKNRNLRFVSRFVSCKKYIQ